MVKHWFLHYLRRAVGTHALMERVMQLAPPEPVVVVAPPPEPPMNGEAATKLRRLYSRIADTAQSDDQLGFNRD